MAYKEYSLADLEDYQACLQRMIDHLESIKEHCEESHYGAAYAQLGSMDVYLPRLEVVAQTALQKVELLGPLGLPEKYKQKNDTLPDPAEIRVRKSARKKTKASKKKKR